MESRYERFIEAVARVGERFIENDVFLRMLEVDADLLMPYVTERLGGSQLEAVRILEQVAAEGQRDGSIRAGDPHVFAAMAESTGRPLVMMARARIRAIPQHVAFDELRVMLDAYLRPRAAQGNERDSLVGFRVDSRRPCDKDGFKSARPISKEEQLRAHSQVPQVPRLAFRHRVALALVLALAALAAVPALAKAASYVAMGDSYASGVGTRDYYGDSGACQRSPDAYPVDVASRIGSPLSFVACSGAKVPDVLNNQLGPLNSGTTEVTISIGGNDAGFSSVITSCARPWPWTCWGDIDRAQSYIRNSLPASLDSVYGSIESRSPTAKVAVVGYPRVFNGRSTCNAASRISSGEQAELNETADLLAGVTRERALAWGFTYVDPIPSFVGHAVCDSSEWINGLASPISESYHPNDAGHDAYGNLVTPAVD